MPIYVPPKRKSIILAFLLPLLFGPLGLLYTAFCSRFQTVALLVLCAAFAWVELGVEGPHRPYLGLINLTSIALSVVAVIRYNRNF